MNNNFVYYLHLQRYNAIKHNYILKINIIPNVDNIYNNINEIHISLNQNNNLVGNY